MKVIWHPVLFYGDTLFQCSIDWDGKTAQATSRSKPRAFAFALEELAKTYHQEADDERSRLGGDPDQPHSSHQPGGEPAAPG